MHINKQINYTATQITINFTHSNQFFLKHSCYLLPLAVAKLIKQMTENS